MNERRMYTGHAQLSVVRGSARQYLETLASPEDLRKNTQITHNNSGTYLREICLYPSPSSKKTRIGDGILLAYWEGDEENRRLLFTDWD
jgi:hypothetical protein